MTSKHTHYHFYLRAHLDQTPLQLDRLMRYFRLSHIGLTAEGLREVEQKDIQVRLQELFRDRKLELENILKNMGTHYERILKVKMTVPHVSKSVWKSCVYLARAAAGRGNTKPIQTISEP